MANAWLLVFSRDVSRDCLTELHGRYEHEYRSLSVADRRLGRYFLGYVF
jgi:hypothetical protein